MSWFSRGSLSIACAAAALFWAGVSGGAQAPDPAPAIGVAAWLHLSLFQGWAFILWITTSLSAIVCYLGGLGLMVGMRAALGRRDERLRAKKWGIEDLDRVYDLEDLAKGDVIFAAPGVTDGSLLRGVKHRRGGILTTESVVMRASSGTVRWVKGEHRSS